MTTAHRPTFDPARGKEDLRGPAYHQRLLPAHTQLKFRKPGQGGAPDASHHTRDLRAELEAAEAAHFAKAKGLTSSSSDPTDTAAPPAKRPLELTGADGQDSDDAEAKRRKILQDTRDIDADSSASDSDSDSDSESDDEEAELQRELERVRRERAERREREERERLAAQQEAQERDIALGNPLLNKADFSVKRRWDDDVVFRNQARGTDDKGKGKEFVNDLLRSDFHKRFMGKYVR